MKRLLWKEFREQGVWGIAWAVSLIGLGTLARAQSVHSVSLPSVALMLFVPLISAIVGAGAYGSELTGNRADFACTKPMPWYRMLLAKLLFAAGVVVVSALVSAIVLRMLTPELYRHLATPLNLLNGAIPLMLVAWTSYAIGLCFSVTLPGAAGGTVVMLSSVVATILMAVSATDVKGQHPVAYFWLILGGLLGTVSAGLVIIRSGLTLPTRTRVIRFSCILAAWLGAMWIVRAVTPDDFVSSRVPDACQYAVFSPDARYALMYVGRPESSAWDLVPGSRSGEPGELPGPNSAYLVRLRDRKIRRLPDGALQFAHWTSADTLTYGPVSAQHTLHMRGDGTLDDQLEQIPPAVATAPGTPARLIVPQPSVQVR